MSFYPFRKIVFLIIFVVLAASAFLVLPGLSQRSETATSPVRQGQRVEPKKDPTPIQEGVMTEKQKQHSKLFKGYGDVAKGRKLRDLVAEKGDVNAGRFVPEQIVPSLTLDEYLSSLGCRADAIVIATVRNQASQVIDEGTFIFTDYQLGIDEIVKNNALSAIDPSAELTVTRSGGAVRLNGHVVQTIDYAQQPLDTGGQYLLFLRYLPATGDYRSFNDSLKEDTFRLQGAKITQVSSIPLPLGTGQKADAISFINRLRNALNNPCGN